MDIAIAAFLVNVRKFTQFESLVTTKVWPFHAHNCDYSRDAIESYRYSVRTNSYILKFQADIMYMEYFGG